MLLHTGEKPYQCPYCSHRANQKNNLRMHIRARHEEWVSSHGGDGVSWIGYWKLDLGRLFMCSCEASVTSVVLTVMHQINEVVPEKKSPSETGLFCRESVAWQRNPQVLDSFPPLHCQNPRHHIGPVQFVVKLLTGPTSGDICVSIQEKSRTCVPSVRTGQIRETICGSTSVLAIMQANGKFDYCSWYYCYLRIFFV